MKKDIRAYTYEQLAAEMEQIGEKKFRAKQIYEWLHVKLVDHFDEMTNLSKALREKLEENPDFNPERKGIRRFEECSMEEQARLIEEDPDYGEVICRCEKVTKAEILKAIHNPLGVHTMTGIKYRTRSMMGRCQGGYCQMRIEKMIEDELGVKDTDIRYARQNSWMFTGEVRKEEQ